MKFLKFLIFLTKNNVKVAKFKRHKTKFTIDKICRKLHFVQKYCIKPITLLHHYYNIRNITYVICLRKLKHSL